MRDVAPRAANLLVSKDCHLCITDFGLSRAVVANACFKGDGVDLERMTNVGEGEMTRHVVTRWCVRMRAGPRARTRAAVYDALESPCAGIARPS